MAELAAAHLSVYHIELCISVAPSSYRPGKLPISFGAYVYHLGPETLSLVDRISDTHFGFVSMSGLTLCSFHLGKCLPERIVGPRPSLWIY
jgi:hypothetical protein